MIVKFMISVPDEASKVKAEMVFFDALDEEGIDYSVVDDDSQELSDLDHPDLPGFRSDDPGTSRKGALDQYPRQKTHLHKALLCVAGAGDYGATYGYVEFHTGIRGVWKRLSELKEGGWIEVRGQRQIPYSGSLGDVYVVTEKARRYIEVKDPAFA